MRTSVDAGATLGGVVPRQLAESGKAQGLNRKSTQVWKSIRRSQTTRHYDLERFFQLASDTYRA